MFLPHLLKFVIGLVFGSFIAALTYRYPRSISNIYGRSFCDNCKNKIKWFDNIPFLSFILLGGKCRDCSEKISWRYPVIEILTAICFTLIGFNIVWLILFCLLEIIFIIDLENQIIPDVFIFTGLFFTLFTVHGSQFTNLFSGFISATFLLIVHLLTKGRGMGLGDVKFAVLGGLIVGLPLFPIWLLIAFLTGAILGIILILGRKANLKSKIAFGPFLIVSIPVTLLWGQKIIDIMLSH